MCRGRKAGKLQRMTPEVEQPPPEHFHRTGPRPRDLILPICALFVSVVSLVVVSLLTPAPAPEKWRPFAATDVETA